MLSQHSPLHSKSTTPSDILALTTPREGALLVTLWKQAVERDENLRISTEALVDLGRELREIQFKGPVVISLLRTDYMPEEMAGALIMLKRVLAPGQLILVAAEDSAVMERLVVSKLRSFFDVRASIPPFDDFGDTPVNSIPGAPLRAHAPAGIGRLNASDILTRLDRAAHARREASYSSGWRESPRRHEVYPAHETMRAGNVTVFSFTATQLEDETRSMQAFCNALDAAAERRGKILVDFSNLSFFDTVGMAALISAHRKCSLVLAGMNPQIEEKFRLGKLDRLLTIAPNRTAGLTVLCQPY